MQVRHRLGRVFELVKQSFAVGFIGFVIEFFLLFGEVSVRDLFDFLGQLE